MKSVKNILTRACAAAPQGINNWTAQLPLVLSSLNARHPYSANVSRAQLQLSPFFYNLLPLLFTPEPFQFNESLLQKQQNNYTILNNLRKSNLAKIASKIFKPANFKLKTGMIVTDSTSKYEKLKINGSRALSPSSLKLFKIINVQHNGLSAVCKDLKTGKTSTKSVNMRGNCDIFMFDGLGEKLKITI